MTLVMENVTCALCGSSEAREYLVREDLNVYLPGKFRLVQCATCGLIYQNPRPAPESMDDIYPPEYDQFSPALKDTASPLRRMDRLYGLRKRVKAVLRYCSAGSLLDVGCATGDFLEAMKMEPGWQVHGIEPNAVAAEYARSTVGVDVKTGLLVPGAYPDATFDVVTMWNVIEHLHDPLDSLCTIHQLLKPGGWLIFNTPNLDSLDAKLYGRFWIGFELPRHFYVFSQATVRHMVEETGFAVAGVRCLYGSHSASMSSLRFWLRGHRVPSGLRNALESFILSRFFRFLMLPYFYLTDRLGLSTAPTFFCQKVSS